MEAKGAPWIKASMRLADGDALMERGIPTAVAGEGDDMKRKSPTGFKAIGRMPVVGCALLGSEAIRYHQ
jgi:hypothetical protein